MNEWTFWVFAFALFEALHLKTIDIKFSFVPIPNDKILLKVYECFRYKKPLWMLLVRWSTLFWTSLMQMLAYCSLETLQWYPLNLGRALANLLSIWHSTQYFQLIGHQDCFFVTCWQPKRKSPVRKKYEKSCKMCFMWSTACEKWINLTY